MTSSWSQRRKKNEKKSINGRHSCKSLNVLHHFAALSKWRQTLISRRLWNNRSLSALLTIGNQHPWVLFPIKCCNEENHQLLVLGTTSSSSSRITTNWNFHWTERRNCRRKRSSRTDWMSKLLSWGFIANFCRHVNNNYNDLWRDCHVWRTCCWCNWWTSQCRSFGGGDEESRGWSERG